MTDMTKATRRTYCCYTSSDYCKEKHPLDASPADMSRIADANTDSLREYSNSKETPALLMSLLQFFRTCRKTGAGNFA
jgi:hypothetical protein